MTQLRNSMKSWLPLLFFSTLSALAVAAPAAVAQSDNPSTAIPFESFKVSGSIQLPAVNSSSGSLALRAQFALGEFSDGIFPGNEDITLLLEPAPSQTNFPPGPCNIVALPAACLVPDKTPGSWKLGDAASCKFQFFLLFPDNTKADLTPFVTDVAVRLEQSPTDKSWELKLQIDLAGLPAVQVPPGPCIIVASIGNDRAVQVASKLDFFGAIAPEN
ncbi:MAG: hypothetical protein L0387_39345 [Acidobacteria bacterium]|nr:hypothetical protein [Acidobacteriota bacterium]